MKVNPIRILSALREKSKSIYIDRDKFGKLIRDAKNKAMDIEEFSVIERELYLIFNLSKDFITGKYRKISKGNMLLIIGALLYLVNPMDIVPDILLGIGFLDDLTVFTYAIAKIKKELDRYEEWKFPFKDE